MWDTSDMTVLHGVEGLAVDSDNHVHPLRFGVVCESPTFRYGVGVLKDIMTLTVPGSGHSP
jgi:hypothetical protein